MKRIPAILPFVALFRSETFQYYASLITTVGHDVQKNYRLHIHDMFLIKNQEKRFDLIVVFLFCNLPAILPARTSSNSTVQST